MAFATTNGAIDASQLEQQGIEALEAAFEGWSPAEGDLLFWLNKIHSRVDAQVYEQAGELEESAFKRFGEAIVRVPPIQAAAAQVESSWTMIDNLGHTVKAGTRVLVVATGDRRAGFVTVEDTVIPPGSTTATILLRAINPGTEDNDLAGPVSLSDSLSFVVEPGGITLIEATGGGVDEEAEDAYLDRLVETLRLLTLSPITTDDFEIDARAVAGIARSLCIPGYNPDDTTENNLLMVCNFPLDAAGANSPAPTRELLQARQQAKVPSGVVVKVGTATRTKVDSATSVAVLAGADPAATKAAVAARVADYLNPANWASSGDPTRFDLKPKVYFNEMIAELDRVAGVDRVVSLLLGSGTGKAFTVAASTDKFTSAAHGFANGDAVVLRTGLVPGAPLAAATVYYVRDVEASAYKLTATVGGAAINVTTDGSGTAVKLGTADITLAGVAPLTEPGEIVVSAS